MLSASASNKRQVRETKHAKHANTRLLLMQLHVVSTLHQLFAAYRKISMAVVVSVVITFSYQLGPSKESTQQKQRLLTLKSHRKEGRSPRPTGPAWSLALTEPIKRLAASDPTLPPRLPLLRGTPSIDLDHGMRAMLGQHTTRGTQDNEQELYTVCQACGNLMCVTCNAR